MWLCYCVFVNVITYSIACVLCVKPSVCVCPRVCVFVCVSECVHIRIYICVCVCGTVLLGPPLYLQLLALQRDLRFQSDPSQSKHEKRNNGSKKTCCIPS